MKKVRTANKLPCPAYIRIPALKLFLYAEGRSGNRSRTVHEPFPEPFVNGSNKVQYRSNGSFYKEMYDILFMDLLL